MGCRVEQQQGMGWDGMGCKMEHEQGMECRSTSRGWDGTGCRMEHEQGVGWDGLQGGAAAGDGMEDGA